MEVAKVTVLNLSGNVGKSTIARHMLLPRIRGAEYFPVETINADEEVEGATQVKGRQFGALMETLLLKDAAVVDVGASNIEEYMKRMREYAGAHEDMDLYVVPVTKERKQIRDTISTIEMLKQMGVPAKKIRVVFNMVEPDESVSEAFPELLAYHEEEKTFHLAKGAVVYNTEAFQKLAENRKTIPEILSDETDWRHKLKEAKSSDEREEPAIMISLRRLAAGVNANLDAAYKSLTA